MQPKTSHLSFFKTIDPLRSRSLLSAVLERFVVEPLIRRAAKDPYLSIGDYMKRDWLRRPAPGRTWALRVQHTLRSDYARALHCHPWDNISVLLRGGYWEVTPGRYQDALEKDMLAADPLLAELHSKIALVQGSSLSRAVRRDFAAAGVFWRGPGAGVRRKAHALHRLVIPEGTVAVSLFAMQPKFREWGFQTQQGWVHNRVYESNLQEVARFAAQPRDHQEAEAITLW